MTVSSALPSWLPFGGQSLSAGTYNAIARPLGIAYLAVLAMAMAPWATEPPNSDRRRRSLAPSTRLSERTAMNSALKNRRLATAKPTTARPL